MSWSYCVPAVVPPISTSREAPALSVKFPVASDSGLLPGATCPPALTVTLCTVPLPASVPPAFTVVVGCVIGAVDLQRAAVDGGRAGVGRWCPTESACRCRSWSARRCRVESTIVPEKDVEVLSAPTVSVCGPTPLDAPGRRRWLHRRASRSFRCFGTTGRPRCSP